MPHHFLMDRVGKHFLDLVSQWRRVETGKSDSLRSLASHLQAWIFVHNPSRVELQASAIILQRDPDDVDLQVQVISREDLDESGDQLKELSLRATSYL